MTMPGRSLGQPQPMLLLLDEMMGPSGPIIRPEPFSDDIRNIPQLVAEKGHGGDLARFAGAVRALPTADTQTLILRLATTSDPLLLWSLHLELDRRDIPPCLRWPANEDTPQAEFVTWLADLLWLTKRHPRHVPRFRGWQGLFKHAPASSAWHATAHRQYLFVAPRGYSVAHWCAKGLALTESQRQNLMALPTNAMRAERHPLQGDRLALTRERLLSHAIEHPDKSGRRRPEAIANRRAGLWRVFQLSGRNQTATAQHWHRLTGETLTRQAVAKQLAIVADALRDRP